jgi:hypothetical protein
MIEGASGFRIATSKLENLSEVARVGHADFFLAIKPKRHPDPLFVAMCDQRGLDFDSKAYQAPSGNLGKPLCLSWLKYNLGSGKCPDNTAFSKAQEALHTLIHPYFEDVKPYTVDEAMAGMKTTTSTGYPYNVSPFDDLAKKKKDILQDPVAFSRATGEVLSALEEFDPEVILGDEFDSRYNVWNCAPKDEILPKKKFDRGNFENGEPMPVGIRSITFPSFPLAVCEAMYMGPIESRYMMASINDPRVGSQIGLTPFYGGQLRMIQKHPVTKDGRPFRVSTSDLTSYDVSQDEKLIFAECEVLCRNIESAQHRQVVRWLHHVGVHSNVVLPNGQVLRKSSGQNSGARNTSGGNTRRRFMLIAYCFFTFYPEATIDDFFENVVTHIMGDDDLIYFHPDYPLMALKNRTALLWRDFGIMQKNDEADSDTLVGHSFVGFNYTVLDGDIVPAIETQKLLSCAALALRKETPLDTWERMRSLAYSSYFVTSEPKRKAVYDLLKDYAHACLQGLTPDSPFPTWLEVGHLWTGQESNSNPNVPGWDLFVKTGLYEDLGEIELQSMKATPTRFTPGRRGLFGPSGGWRGLLNQYFLILLIMTTLMKWYSGKTGMITDLKPEDDETATPVGLSPPPVASRPAILPGVVYPVPDRLGDEAEDDKGKEPAVDPEGDPTTVQDSSITEDYGLIATVPTKGGRLSERLEPDYKKGEQGIRGIPGLSAQDSAAIIAATDPAHAGDDATYLSDLVGLPDGQDNAQPMLSYPVTRRVTAAQPSGLKVGETWDLHVYTGNILERTYVQQGLIRPAGIDPAAVDTTQSSAARVVTSYNPGPTAYPHTWGAINLVAVKTGMATAPVRGEPFAFNLTDPNVRMDGVGIVDLVNPQAGNFQTGLSASDLCDGAVKVIGLGFEVLNPTAVLTRAGAVTSYRLPSSASEEITVGYRLGVNATAKGLNNTTLTTRFVDGPPSYLKDVAVVPNSSQELAAHGSYVTATPSHLMSPAVHPRNVRQVIAAVAGGKPRAEGGENVGQSYPSGAITPTQSIPCLLVTLGRGGTAQSSGQSDSPAGGILTHDLNFNRSGVYFTGLPYGSTLIVDLKATLSSPAPVGDQRFALASSLPPPYNPVALQVLSRMYREMPSGALFSENGTGAFFKNLVSGIRTALPVVQQIVGAVGGGSRSRPKRRRREEHEEEETPRREDRGGRERDREIIRNPKSSARAKRRARARLDS